MTAVFKPVVSVQVLPSPSPSLYKEATHLFADFSRLKPGDFKVDVTEASAQGVECLKPEYIADYLMQVKTQLFSFCNEKNHIKLNNTNLLNQYILFIDVLKERVDESASTLLVNLTEIYLITPP